MLMLLFYVGNDRYALESKLVIEVIPKVELKKLHNAPNYMPGLFNYRNRLVPVIDLCHLIGGHPCSSHLSTRIILVNYQGETALSLQETLPENYLAPTSHTKILGLMAERITGTLRKQETELFDSGIQVDAAPYLGEMIADGQGMIQCIHVEHLLPDSQKKFYF
ncbi:chemotaxis protein CheW [Iningainema sp. BLCCT55]|uniref:Chemotaxis protein CheW n=2 Tax=Iningainema TaxID=1932705 RepID=A0A8J6XJS7_9CYAN|nr:chemotaxis protein CheW [Iningainema tapete]MBD2774162.1 chemotaxis protein CheW [Iningainema tapete BLCC-T55]